MRKTVDILISLLRFVFCGAMPEGPFVLTEDEAEKLFVLSKKHDVTQIIAYALEKAGYDIPEKAKKNFHQSKVIAVYRHELMEAEYLKITTLLEEEHIKYIPLKGVVLKKLYPESWMRTCGDIDILVEKDNAEKVANLLKEKLGYRIKVYGNHDIVLMSPYNVEAEIHFKLVESYKKIDDVLSHVWEEIALIPGKKYAYAMSEEFFYFYHIAHAVKHFRVGGIGVRSFVDFWLINENFNFDYDKVKEMLKRGGIEKFEEKVVSLSQAWLHGTKKDELTELLGEFIVKSGVHGSVWQYITIKQEERKGKLGYILRRIFEKKNVLIKLYPKLEKYPFLYPYYTVRRWGRIFKPGRLRYAGKELKVNASTDNKYRKKVARLLKELEI